MVNIRLFTESTLFAGDEHMPSPIKTLAHFQRFCALNMEFQGVDWLRYAVHTTTENGDCWSVKQDESRIELHVCLNEALLLLWIPDAPLPPMDNIKPQWDTTPMVQSVLAKCDEFPYGIAWTSRLENVDWSSIWLATQWWPEEGQTDAVDDPTNWLRWWWTQVMEFTTEPPSLYDSPIAQ